MTTRNKGPRRPRLWTTIAPTITLLAAQTGVASQSFLGLGGPYTTATGRELQSGVTIARVFCNLLVEEVSPATSAVTFCLAVGVGVFTQNIDAGDFPDLELHEGDWFLHDVRPFAERKTSLENRLVHPTTKAQYQLETRAQRKINRRDETPFLLMQKDAVTDFDIVVTACVTILWLTP